MQQVNEYHNIIFEYIPTEMQIADILTKPLAPKDFYRLRALLLGLHEWQIVFCQDDIKENQNEEEENGYLQWDSEMEL